MQEAASEVGVAMLARAVDEQYIVELNKMFVGYCNQDPLSIITHLYDQWVKVTNTETVAAINAFNCSWDNTPDLRIRSYGRQLKKRQRCLKNEGAL